MLIERLEDISRRVLASLAGAVDLASLEELEVAALGRKSELITALKELGQLPADERKIVGQRANEIRQKIEGVIAARRAALEQVALGVIAESEKIDVTLPSLTAPLGHEHLSTQAIRDIEAIFARVGFRRSRIPEVEWDWFSFEALNMPPDHPARDEWETFFVDAPRHDKLGRMVLTPHTSSGQIREMQRRELPIRMIAISKCYRRQIDVSHVPMFHQFEGLLIDKGVSVTHLKGVLDYFAQTYFGPERKTRLRPFHFRFTEPSFEVDISCGICGGTGKIEGEKCRLCKDGWLELGGAGMVHPNVLKSCGIDAEEWGGFAFGWGLERTMMMRSGVRIPDIRELYRGDFRFLRQF